MKFTKKFTNKNKNPYNLFEYKNASSFMKNTDGSTVFQMNDIEVPKEWSQVAVDILSQKYFRKAGVPLFDSNGKPVLDEYGRQKNGSETSIKQVVHRLAGCWKYWGEKYKYFDSEEDAQAFYDESTYMLLNQMAAPNSPQWFNTGLNFSYGITGKKQGHYYVDPDTKKVVESKDAYTRPQPHACFIQAVKDDLVNEGGIFDLASREARIFKFGSGTGTNFSSLRGAKEPLSGGGISSGLMSFLRIFDRAAGAIKSGGTTRRAAKMVIVDIDHPDIEEFIEWKAIEEEKVAALVTGSRVNGKFLQAILDEAIANGADRKINLRLNNLIHRALRRGVPLNYIMRVLSLVKQGFTTLNLQEYTAHFESEAYNTVSGQNSNNSVRITNDFMLAIDNDDYWELKWRTDSNVRIKIKARDLWTKINLSAWKCADPGLQFDTTINEWHTCPNSGRINASNPCSEYMFLDDTACNLASLNLMKFYDSEKNEFLVEDFRHAVRIWTVILEISVLMAQFPSKRIAQLSYDFRTLGLGYANLGTLLMVSGIPYDSPEALALTGSITAILTGESYRTSAEMASELGTFSEFNRNREQMLRVIRNHRRAVYNVTESDYEDLTIKPMGLNKNFCPEYLLNTAQATWDEALELGEKFGFRNAQVSVIAPTGTIGLIMDCDTTGIEPDFAIVKYKKLSGGGYFKIVNQSVRIALTKLGYTPAQIDDIDHYCIGHGTLKGCPTINPKILLAKGFTKEKLDIIEKELKNVFDIRFAFNKWLLGEDFIKQLGITDEQLNSKNFNMLNALGFSQQDVETANDYVCGTMMLEGAPHINEIHLPIFDTANKCGKNGKRYIQYMAHVRMMSAAQPFVTGAISKTVNIPAEATIDNISDVHVQSWKMMLKSIALYRDGSKLSQPLNSSNYEDLDEIVMLGDENNLDETLGQKEVQQRISDKLAHTIPYRRRLPKKRTGYVREAHVGGHKVYLRTGEYEDGSLGEIFIDMYKEGASFKGLLNCFSVLASKALQYGIPLEELVDTFTFTRFEPAGVVAGHDNIKSATSILDYVFRTLGYDYLGRTDFVHYKAVDETPNGKHHNGNGHDSEKNGNHNEPATETHTHETTDDLDSHLSMPDIEVEISETQDNTISTNESVTSYEEAKMIGYTGEQCSNCGSIRVVRNGNCFLCRDCGETSGCS